MRRGNAECQVREVARVGLGQRRRVKVPTVMSMGIDKTRHNGFAGDINDHRIDRNLNRIRIAYRNNFVALHQQSTELDGYSDDWNNPGILVGNKLV